MRQSDQRNATRIHRKSSEEHGIFNLILHGREKRIHKYQEFHLVAVAALLLAAVGSSERQPGIALAADHLVGVVLLGEGSEAGLEPIQASAESPGQAERELKRGLLLDAVVRQRPPVVLLLLQLLPGEDHPLLLVRRPHAYVRTRIIQHNIASKLTDRSIENYVFLMIKITFLGLDLALTSWRVWLLSTSRVMVFPAGVLAKICIFFLPWINAPFAVPLPHLG